MTQAKVGGEIGMNGEFYQGGEFLPSSPNTIKGEFTRQQIKGQKLQASKEATEINEKINAALLIFYPNHNSAQARELFAKYLRENGINTRNINIYSTDLAKWVL